MNNNSYTSTYQNTPNNNFYNLNELYLDNILKLNKGEKVRIYQSFPNQEEVKEFTGIIEQNGKDYIVLSDPTTGNWNLLFLVYTNYIKFDEDINII